MPEIGEIKYGREIGKKPFTGKFIWKICIDCGEGRWGRSGKQSQRCFSCAMKTSSHCEKLREARKKRRGKESPGWKGGRIISYGYVMIKLQPDDFFYSMANVEAYVYEHRLVMAKHLGRCLHRWEIVHHKHTMYPAGSIEDKQDNRLRNLQLVSDDRHKQITILESKISSLESKIDDLLKLSRLLLWHITQSKVEVNNGKTTNRFRFR